MNTAVQFLQSHLQTLPLELQTYIASSNWLDTLHNSFLPYNFEGGAKRVIENEILYALLGLESPYSLLENISRQLSLPEEKLEVFIEEIFPRIFTLDILTVLSQFQESVEKTEGDIYREPIEQIVASPQNTPSHRNFSGTPYQGRPGAPQTPARPPLAPLPSYQKDAPASQPTQTPPERTRDPYREPPL